MAHSRVRRFVAAFLLGVLGSGFALPGLDELLYHRVPAGVRADLAHVDQPGGCNTHAEHCIAAAMVYAPRLAVAPTPAPSASVAAADRAPAIFTSTPRSSDRKTPQQPRAPPAA